MASAIVEKRSAGAAEFVERFREVWADPTPERLMALAHPDVVLEQPMMPKAVGRDEGRESFRRLLDALPGLHGEVLSWAADRDVIFIELRLSAPTGRRPLEWTVVDRIELEDGLVRRRVAYFDSAALIAKVVVRPALWRGQVALLRARRQAV